MDLKRTLFPLLAVSLGLAAVAGPDVPADACDERGTMSSGCLARLRDVRLFRGDERCAYRDPAAVYADGRFHLFFTYIDERDGYVAASVRHSESTDLVTWSPPVDITVRDSKLNYSSPGNVVRDGDTWVLCCQTYPRPGARLDDLPPRWGDQTCRLFVMRSRDLRHWGEPELLRVKGPDVPVEAMGRMIDPYLLKEPDGLWRCFYKQNGVSFSVSPDLRTWKPVGRADAGENVCVLPVDGGGWMMFHSPANGIGVKRSHDLVRWHDDHEVLRFGQDGWPWAKGRLTAGTVLDARNVKGVGKYLMFFHGSGPLKEEEGDFDKNASIGLAWSDDLIHWSWPGEKRSGDRTCTTRESAILGHYLFFPPNHNASNENGRNYSKDRSFRLPVAHNRSECWFIPTFRPMTMKIGASL